jgi:hypothetical protein
MFLSDLSVSFQAVKVFPAPGLIAWFLGTASPDGSLLSRESGDFPTYEAAAAALGSSL